MLQLSVMRRRAHSGARADGNSGGNHAHAFRVRGGLLRLFYNDPELRSSAARQSGGSDKPAAEPGADGCCPLIGCEGTGGAQAIRFHHLRPVNVSLDIGNQELTGAPCIAMGDLPSAQGQLR